MADNMNVPMELYKNTVPGLFTTGIAKNAFIQFFDFLANALGSGSIPSDMMSISLTVSAARFAEIVSGNSWGKNEMTLSESLSLFSLTKNPTAVEVNVLLAE